jgi:hypothetical protein
MATEIAEVQAGAQTEEQVQDWVAKPQAEHAWLHRLVGEWRSECVASCMPGEPAVNTTGTLHVRSIGGLWIQGEAEGEMPGGGQMTSLITLGYDPQKGSYVGTWIGSMMTLLWVYHGTREGERLILASEGPNFTDPTKTALYHDIIEIHSDDHHSLSARVQNEDGWWTDMMRTDYYRTA